MHMHPRIAYVINQYPTVSHSFIRREILALERQGFEIHRISLRGWNSDLADEADRQERQRTRYVLRRGVFPLLCAALKTLCIRPRSFLNAMVLAIQMWRGSDRSLAYHVVYLAEACRILAWLRRLGVSHVHAHFGTNSTEVVMLTHALGGPTYSFTVHGAADFDRIKSLHLEEKVRRAAFVTAVCSYGRSQLYREISRSQWPKVQVVHCGLESSFHSIPQPSSSDRFRLVCVGRLAPEKGQLLLLEAMRRITAKGMQVNLVLAGDGPLRSEIEAVSRQLGLERQVRVTGWISGQDVQKEILAAQALIVPSFAEGLPVVIMEAMALRRPVLASYVGGIPELVSPGKHGWLFPPGSLDDLTHAMEQFITTPIEALQTMGAAAQQRVLERHSIDTEAAKLGALFRAVL
jgi:colanic acid/amylovoran biosynthesis glycosyltransferase